jgi:serine/threonine protein kinase
MVPSPKTPPELIAVLRTADLLDPEQLDALAARPARGNAASLAHDLVEDGILTDYQAKLLLEGQGQQLCLGVYRLQKMLGEGGMGQVFQAVQRRLNRLVAVKVLHPALIEGNPGALRRFQREAQAAAGLSHPNIVVVYDADCSDGTYYIAMEFVDGTDLSRLVKQAGPLPIAQACEYIRQAALGLQHAHEAGLVHRDIKPHNLMLTFPAPVGASVRSGVMRVPSRTPGATPAAPSAGASGRVASTGLVKLLDLGLCRVLAGGSHGEKSLGTLTNENTIMGTPDYIAPEQARNPHAADIRSDLYSLGCTLYFLLSGRPPFQGDGAIEKLLMHQMEVAQPIEDVRPEVPRPLAALIRKLMAKRPDDRFQEPQAVAETLAEIVGGMSGSWMRRLPADPPPAEADTVTPPGLTGLSAASTMIAAGSTGRSSKPVAGAQTRAEMCLLSGKARKLAVLTGHTAHVTAFGFSAEGGLLATGSLDDTVRIWDVAAARPVERAVWRSSHLGAVSTVAFHPGRSAVALGPSTADGRMWHWDWLKPPGGRALRFQGEAHSVDALAFSPRGDLLASGGGTSVWLWNVGSDRVKRRATLKGHRAAVKAVAFAPCGRRLATSGEDSIIRLWQVGRWWATQKNVLVSYTGAVTTLAYSPDGRHLASAGLDHEIRIWDATGEEGEERAVFGRLDGVIRQVLFLDDRRVLAAGDRGQIMIWDIESKQRLQEWRLDTGLICCLAVSRNGLVATGSTDGRVTVYELGIAAAAGEPAPASCEDDDDGEVVLAPPSNAVWQTMHDDKEL